MGTASLTLLLRFDLQLLVHLPLVLPNHQILSPSLPLSLHLPTHIMSDAKPASGLLDEIAKGKELKKTQAKPSGDSALVGQLKLQSEIKNGVSLKKTSAPSTELTEAQKAAFMEDKAAK